MDVVRSITVFHVLLMLVAPIVEEVAWRGYGQDGLQSRFGLASTSLLLGLLWWSWHLPLFFMADTYQSGLGLLTIGFLEFFVWCVATAFVMTWIFNETRGSILAAIVYHFMLNLANETLRTSTTADLVSSATQIAVAVAVFAVLPRMRRPRRYRGVTRWLPPSEG